MEATKLKYTIIKKRDQYDEYCRNLEALLGSEVDAYVQDEIDLLTLLIETYDEAHSAFTALDPIALLRSFMAEHHLKPQQLVDLLGVSKGYISDILNYKKGLSKEVIRKLATHFKVRQEAFNRPYKLKIASTRPEFNISKSITQHAANHQ
ncbi:HTH-type transcriptional regulator / antitoxin HigA [Mucilaginibacter pineti]|uniref:HTH-type transcriptional regulator / antitoxin HigA n=1 Tax=Mucilaginibacter pineti TaxID=1391627 RepID=A0A1G6ZGH5_9SPHI|nr:helix-turn-helix domain-containing protein [Mucilaginibacter pineti]SDE01483.1 HTH-type transcriptional regulator / antitoxin HigA [Mucilaginibacter pineti]